MQKEKLWPEVHVEEAFLTTRDDIVTKVLKLNNSSFNVRFEHPVLGEVVEIFHRVAPNLLGLKSIYCFEAQEDPEILDIAKDYYNNFLLDGEETYLEYFNDEVGYFLLSRNVRELKDPFGF